MCLGRARPTEHDTCGLGPMGFHQMIKSFLPMFLIKKDGGLAYLQRLCLTASAVVQSLSHVRLFATPWTTAHQASLFFTISWSLLKLVSIKSVMPSNHLILCCPLLLLPSIFPSIRVFSNESVLPIRWPKYWNFSFSISPSNECLGLISFRIDWFDLLAVQGLSRVYSNTTVQKHQLFSAQPSLLNCDCTEIVICDYTKNHITKTLKITKLCTLERLK